jgi:hypothetical protein
MFNKVNDIDINEKKTQNSDIKQIKNNKIEIINSNINVDSSSGKLLYNN